MARFAVSISNGMCTVTEHGLSTRIAERPSMRIALREHSKYPSLHAKGGGSTDHDRLVNETLKSMRKLGVTKDKKGQLELLGNGSIPELMVALECVRKQGWLLTVHPGMQFDDCTSLLIL